MLTIRAVSLRRCFIISSPFDSCLRSRRLSPYCFINLFSVNRICHYSLEFTVPAAALLPVLEVVNYLANASNPEQGRNYEGDLCICDPASCLEFESVKFVARLCQLLAEFCYFLDGRIFAQRMGLVSKVDGMDICSHHFYSAYDFYRRWGINIVRGVEWLCGVDPHDIRRAITRLPPPGDLLRPAIDEHEGP